jgi:hypothetical protein
MLAAQAISCTSLRSHRSNFRRCRLVQCYIKDMVDGSPKLEPLVYGVSICWKRSHFRGRSRTAKCVAVVHRLRVCCQVFAAFCHRVAFICLGGWFSYGHLMNLYQAREDPLIFQIPSTYTMLHQGHGRSLSSALRAPTLLQHLLETWPSSLEEK